MSSIEVVAGNGLLHRRAFLTGGAALCRRGHGLYPQRHGSGAAARGSAVEQRARRCGAGIRDAVALREERGTHALEPPRRAAHSSTDARRTT